MQESWNHNLHYHQAIIDLIARDCQSALDVGCGQGALTRRLRQLIPDVMADMLRPGGVLAVIGLARDFSLATAALIVPAMIGNWLHRAADAWRLRASARPAEIAHTSPVIWPPGMTDRQVRRLAKRVLPGVRYRRRLYWRYSLAWHKPKED